MAEESLALSHQTPTSAIEALSVLHQLEVQAETHFVGIAGVIDIDGRMQALDKEIARAVGRFATAQRRQAEINTKIAIIRRLVKVFKDSCRFDEELELQSRERVLVCEAWYEDTIAFSIFKDAYKMPNIVARAVCRPFVEALSLLAYYANFAVSSLVNLATATVLSIFLIALVFVVTSKTHSGGAIGFETGLFMAITSSVGVAAPAAVLHAEDVHYSHWVVALAMLSGVFHFALGASFAYTRVIRR